MARRTARRYSRSKNAATSAVSTAPIIITAGNIPVSALVKSIAEFILTTAEIKFYCS
jgi:hypothetical protein